MHHEQKFVGGYLLGEFRTALTDTNTKVSGDQILLDSCQSGRGQLPQLSKLTSSGKDSITSLSVRNARHFLQSPLHRCDDYR